MTSKPPRRWTRPVAIVGIGLLTLLVTILALLQLPPVATWVMRRVITVVPLSPGHELEVGSVSGDWLHRLVLNDVRLLRDDHELARIDRLRAEYDLRELRGPRTRLNLLTAEGGSVVARRQEDGWDLAKVLRRSADTTQGGGNLTIERLELRDLELVAQLNPDSAVRVRGLALRARNLVIGDDVVLDIDGLNAAIAPPGTARWFAVATRGAVTAEELRLDPLRVQTEQTLLAGRLVLPRDLDDARLVDRLDVRLDATPLALADLAALVPAVTPEGELRFQARATGSDDGLVTASLGAQLDEARLALEGVAPLSNERADYRVHGTLRRVDPARFLHAAPAGSLSGRVDAELRGRSLDRSSGRIELRLRPSRLAGTTVERLDIRARMREGSAELALDGVIDDGVVTASGRVEPFDSVPRYRLRGGATGLPGSAVLARSLAGPEGDPVLDVRFRVAGAGLAPDAARLSGTVELTAVRQDGSRSPLGQSTIALTDGRIDAHPELLVGGGTITADVVARLGDTLTYEVRRGKIESVDLGESLADTSIAPLSGQFALSGRGLAPANAVASAHVMLDELIYGARRVEQVTGRARLASGRARIDLRGMLAGGRLMIAADARPFNATKTFHLRRAVLDRVDLGSFLGRPDLSGPVSLSMTGNGRFRGDDRSLRGQVTLGRSRLGHIEVHSGSLDGRLSGELLTYSSSIMTDAGAFAAAGDGRPLSHVPFYAIREGRVDSVDLGTLLGRPDLRTALTSRFSGSVSGSSTDSMQAKLSLALLPSRINGAQINSGRAELTMAEGAVRGDVRIEGRDGELVAEVSGQAGDAMQLHADGNLRLERVARWTGRPDADGRLESRFVLDAAGDSAGVLSLGGSLDARGGIGGVRVHAVHLALIPTPGAIELDTLFVRSNVATLDGGGRVALRKEAGSDTLRITGTTVDVTALGALAGSDSVSLDSANVAVTLSGPAEHWRLDGEADVYRVLAAGSLAERARLEVGAALNATGVSGLAGRLEVEGAAYGKTRIPELQVSGRYDSLITLQANVAIGDSVRLTTSLRGITGDTTRAVLQQFDIAEGGRVWSLEQPANMELSPRLMMDGFGLRAGNRRITVNGVFDRRSASDMTARITNLDLEAFRAVGLSPIGGRLDGWVRLSGPAAAPTLEGSIGLGLRGKDGKEIGRIRTDLDWTREALRVDATAAPLKGGRLTVNGTLPWSLSLAPADTTAAVEVVRGSSDTLALAVRADSFDLRVFEPLLPPESARELYGALVVDARVTGTLRAPRADGSVRVSRAGLTVPTIDVRYERGELVGQLAGDELRIERLELRTAKKERLTASGVVRLQPLDDPALDLKADLKDFRIANSAALKSHASGTVHLAGTAQMPTLTGRLTLGRSEIIVGGSEASASVEKVELTPEDLRQLARHFGPTALARADDSPGLVDRFHIDLNLGFPGRVWFRKKGSPKADIELSGRIGLRQEPGEPMQFFGRVEPIPGRGTLDVYGREFRLTGGNIVLAGPTDSTRLDVTAQYRVPTQGGAEDEGVVVDLAARGRPDSLALEFTADPAMSQDDMISYIVTGRPSSDNLLAEQAAGEESAGEMGAQVALSGLSESLSDVAEEQLGLDVFQIRQEGLHGLTLTAGRYVGSRVFLSLHLPIELGSRAQQAPGASLGPSFELEYAARRWIRANLRGGNVPPRFTLRSRYAY